MSDFLLTSRYQGGQYAKATTLVVQLIDDIKIPDIFMHAAAEHQLRCVKSKNCIINLSQTLLVYKGAMKVRPNSVPINVLFKACSQDLAAAKERERVKSGGGGGV